MNVRIKIVVLSILVIVLFSFTVKIPKSTKSKKIVSTQSVVLKKEFKAKGFKWGSEVYFRVFKKEKQFEIWVKKGNKFSLFKTLDICYFSGGLGTKTRVGDRKSPEGFYFIRPSQLNPFSKYHLSFNIGYPNTYERQKGYSGSAIMIHGNCVSIGCYALGNKNIETVYTLLEKALEFGQPFARIHIFPFKLTKEKMSNSAVKSNTHFPLWKNMQTGYELFEKKKVPPNVEVKNGKYVFNY